MRMSTSCLSVLSMRGRSSGMTLYTAFHLQHHESSERLGGDAYIGGDLYSDQALIIFKTQHLELSL